MVKDRRFVGRAWKSLASTKNVFGKILLILLLQLVPILGQIVTYGYVLGWMREAAWGFETPMPAHVLGGGDDKFWAHGVKGFFVQLLYALLFSIVGVVAAGLLGMIANDPRLAHSITGSVLVALVVATAVVAIVFLLIEFVMGLIRLSLYNDFGSAWQWGAGLSMAAVDFGGLVKIAVVNFLYMVLSEVLIVTAIALPMVIALVTGFAQWDGMIDSAQVFMNVGPDSLSYSEVTSLILATSMTFGALPLLWTVAILLLSVPMMIFSLVCYRALGNWAAQLDVVHWGPSSEPLPAGAVKFGQQVPDAPVAVADSAIATPLTSVSQDAPASAAPASTAADSANPASAAPASDASASAAQDVDTKGSGSHNAAVDTALAMTQTDEEYVAPAKQSRPILIIVMSYVVSWIIVLAGTFGLVYAGKTAAPVLQEWIQNNVPANNMIDFSDAYQGSWNLSDLDATLTLNPNGTFVLADSRSQMMGTYSVATQKATDKQLEQFSKLANVEVNPNLDSVAYRVVLTPLDLSGSKPGQSATIVLVFSKDLGRHFALVVTDKHDPFLAARLFR